MQSGMRIGVLPSPVLGKGDGESDGEVCNLVNSNQATSDKSSPDALLRVFLRCQTAIHRYLMVRSGNDRALCDDLMQTLWVRASGSSEHVPENEMEFWLRGIARNLLLTHISRTEANRKNIPRADPHLAAALADPISRSLRQGQSLWGKEASDQLMLALTNLPADDQELILAHYVRGESQTRLGERFGLSTRAVEARLYRAKKELREQLRSLVD